MKSQFEPTTVQHRDPPAPSGRSALSRLADGARRIEPGVAGAVAAATGWLAATSHSELPVLWFSCVLAAAVACWAASRRVVGRLEVLARAVALLAGAYLLHAAGGPASLLSAWLGMAAGYYMVVLPVAAWLARSGAARADDAATDRSTALYNRAGLLTHGRVLLASCRAERRELTLALFDCADLLEARTVYGSRTSRKLVDSIVRKLTLLAGHQGLAARTGPTQFAVAMPMPREKAMQAIERLLGNPARFELEGGDSEIVLVPHLMVEAVPAAGTLERMFVALCRGLARVQEEERLRQLYLQRERERHSRPMPVQADRAPAPRARAPLLDPDPVVHHQIPNTIPMPLGAR
jgi:GGDEF domain-containing protein